MYFGQHQQQYAQRGPPVDNAALRRKEEQRRRQQEYAQALAQQVAQHEQQKQRERELDRRATGATNGIAYQQRGNFNANAAPPPPPTANAEQQRGLFDGFGQNEHKSHTSFARGQRQVEQPHQWQQHQQEQPTQWQQQQQEQAYYQQQQQQRQGRPPSAINYVPPPPHGQMPQPMAHQYDAPNPWSTNSNTSQWPTPAEYHQLPPHHSFAAGGRDDYAPHQQFQQGGVSPARETQPAWFSPDAQPGFNNNGFGSNGPGYPGPPSPVREAQQQQPQQFGRRVRTDINGGGENRKVQQQLELQNALQLQIEEKNRQKLDAKRRKEEEDRKEMERLAAEQRAHELEQERIREEKRRRAEEEAMRAQQAAAAVALADQKARAEHQQRIRATQQREDAPIPSLAAAIGRASPPKNPFVDSRAHLFQDPSAPRLPATMSSPSIAPMAQHPSPRSQFPATNGGYAGHQSPGTCACIQRQQPNESFQQQQQGGGREEGARYSPGRSMNAGAFHQHSQQTATAWQSREMDRGIGAAIGVSAPPIDPTALLRQYDDMRQELARQQQLMDQLHRAQSELQHRIQSQQQQESASPSRSPTLTDLNRLRDELREELELRERMHRRELEALKRAHQQQQQHSQSFEGGSLREQTVLVPIVNERISASNRLPVDSSTLASSSSGNLAAESISQPVQLRSESLRTASRVDSARGSHRQPQRAMPFAAPGILKSLDCDSKFVYFNGAIVHDKEAPGKPDDRGGKRVVLEPLDEDDGEDRTDRDDGEEDEVDSAREELSDSVDELVASSTVIRALRLSTQSFEEDDGGNQELSSSRKWIQPRMSSQQVSNNNNDGNNRCASSLLAKSQHAPATRAARASTSIQNQRSSDDQDAGDTDDGDDALEFFVRSFPSASGPSRYISNSYDGQQRNTVARSGTSGPVLNTLDADDSDGDEDDASLNGEQLEALFQRNVRRHEILLGFQQRARAARSSRSSTHSTRSSVEPTRLAWAELHHQLEANREATGATAGSHREGAGPRSSTEPALVGSSRWMPPLLG